MDDKYLDCVVIGYNELPFERYENFLRNYGEYSEAYRDLRFSFVNLGDKKLDYTGLLNYAREQSPPPDDRPLAQAEFNFESGKLRRTAIVPENNSLDENFIDWRYFSAETIGATIQTRTARSCAFKCSFCNYPTRAGALTLTSLDVVERELNSMRELGNVQNVVFIDDTFNVPLPRFKEICRLMI